MDNDITSTNEENNEIWEETSCHAGILIAHSAALVKPIDRKILVGDISFGRTDESNVVFKHDDLLSKRHFAIKKVGDRFEVSDLGSKNGTFLNGIRIESAEPLLTQSIIRAGNTLIVFEEDARHAMIPVTDNSEIVGPFYAPFLVRSMREASKSNRPILITGPSGCGKELAATGIVQMKTEAAKHDPLVKSNNAPGKHAPLVIHNAAHFTSEEEAESTIFGIADKVFSNVDQRAGLIEQAEGGFLFLDEIQSLPERIQKSLLRLIVDGYYKRFGASEMKKANVKFIFASNAPSPYHGLSPDFLARTRVVHIPSIAERRADIPAIFKSTLLKMCEDHNVASDGLLKYVNTNYYEAMCLDGFEENNVRGIIDICDRIITRYESTDNPFESVKSVFQETYHKSKIARRTQDWFDRPDTPVSKAESTDNLSQTRQAPDLDNGNYVESKYEQHRSLIISTYVATDKNLTKTLEKLEKATTYSFNWNQTKKWLKTWGVIEETR